MEVANENILQGYSTFTVNITIYIQVYITRVAELTTNIYHRGALYTRKLTRQMYQPFSYSQR